MTGVQTHTAFEPLYSPLECAAALGCKRSKVYVLLSRGELSAIHIGASTKIRKSVIDQYLANAPKAEFRPLASAVH